MLIEIWEVYTNGVDGIGRYQLYGYMSSQERAQQTAKEIWGSCRRRSAYQDEDGNIYVLASDEPIVLDELKEDKERAAALGKLTSRERQLLGIEE